MGFEPPQIAFAVLHVVSSFAESASTSYYVLVMGPSRIPTACFIFITCLDVFYEAAGTVWSYIVNQFKCVGCRRKDANPCGHYQSAWCHHPDDDFAPRNPAQHPGQARHEPLCVCDDIQKQQGSGSNPEAGARSC